MTSTRADKTQLALETSRRFRRTHFQPVTELSAADVVSAAVARTNAMLAQTTATTLEPAPSAPAPEPAVVEAAEVIVEAAPEVPAPTTKSRKKKTKAEMPARTPEQLRADALDLATQYSVLAEEEYQIAMEELQKSDTDLYTAVVAVLTELNADS